MVSIVIPVYKVERFLPDCMESILSQSYTDLQVLLVDDGSPDRCGVMCDEYARRDDRVQVIHQKNAGLSAARNSGIEAAEGEYIIFVDSDDFLLPGIVQRFVETAEQEKAELVVCRHMRCEEDDSPTQVKGRGVVVQPVCYEGEGKMSQFLRGRDISTPAWAKMYKTKLFAQVRYPVGKYHEDVFTTYRLVHEANKVAVLDEDGYVYRKNGNSITTEGFSERRLDSIEGKIEQASFIEENYPELAKYAYIGVVYSCNQCLLQIAMSNYGNARVLENMQVLYRKYGKYYLSGKVSFFGKIVTALAMIRISLARTAIRLAGRRMG